MTYIRLNRCFLLSLLLIVHGECASEICEDRSTTVEKGYVNCMVNGPYIHPAVLCDIECVPGFVAHPQAQITCSSSGRQILKIDSNGQRSYVTTGTWNGNITTDECRAPTSCITFKDPKNGRKFCTSQGDAQTCLRICQYPYEMSEPIHQREHCGPETSFFWSHVIRNNSTEVPPCFFPQKCRPLQDTDLPEHGKLRCKNEEWANTTICKVNCERGYVPKDNNKTEVFCGPTTAYIWSHVHVNRNSSARIEGCKQSPITTEVAMTVGKTCKGISAAEKEDGAQKLNLYLRSKLLDMDENSNFTFMAWNSYCTDETATSELTYSLYYKTLCSGGQCKEACRVLNLTHNRLCVDVCLSKVEQFRSSIENQQVKHLQTLYVGKLMAAVDFPADVSTAYSTINGAKFKSLNVTTVPMKTNNVAVHHAQAMRFEPVNYYRSKGGKDKC